MPASASPTPEHRSRPTTAAARTELAWNRSGLAVLVCISVLLRRLWPLDRTGTVVALFLIAAGATVWSVGLYVARRSAGRGPSAPMGDTTARLLSFGAFALAAAAFVLGFFPPA